MYAYGISVIVQEAGVTTDPFSNEETEDWSNPTETVVNDCAVAPKASQETNDEGHVSQVVTGRILYCPPATPITSSSRVVIGEEVWEVDGDPFEWMNPFTGWRPGMEVNLRRANG